MDVGASCKGHFKATSREDLKRRVLGHFRTKHGVESTQTIEGLVERHTTVGGTSPRVPGDAD